MRSLLALMLALAAVLIGVVPAQAVAGTVYVDATWSATVVGTDPDGAGPATSFGLDSFATITAALAVTPNRIEVGPGTYAEQLIITSAVELVGAGSGLTTITTPPVLALVHTLSAIVAISNTAVTMSKLTVAGPTLTAGLLFVGIMVVDGGSLTLHDAAVASIRTQPMGSAQTGFSILIGTSAAHGGASTATAVLNRVRVSDYQKAGVIIRPGSNLVMTDSTIQGQGPQCINAGNGVQIEGAAQISNSRVLDNRYVDRIGTPGCGSGAATSYGIRANNTTGPVSLVNNVVSGNENSITINSTTAAGSSLEIRGNTITGLNSQPVGVPLGDESWGIYSEWSRPTAIISGNTIVEATTGIQLQANGAVVQVTSNQIRRNSTGIAAAAQPASFAANAIVGNTAGVTGSIGTGGPNWWGCNLGPGASGCDTSAGGYTEPDWLVLRFAIPACTVIVGADTGAAASLDSTVSGAQYSAAYVPPTSIGINGGSLITADPPIGPTANGALLSQLVGISAGQGTATATADNATVTVPGPDNCARLAVVLGTLPATGGSANWTVLLAALVALLTGTAIGVQAKRRRGR